MKLGYGAGLLALGLLAPLAAASGAPKETVIYRFYNSPGDNHCPTSIIAGPGGVLYGSLGGCGSRNYPDGIYKLTPPSPGHLQWTETTINTGAGRVDGGLVLGKDGSIYGATHDGANGYGSVFRTTPPGAGKTQWTTTILHEFSQDKYADGTYPSYGVVAGPDGALYGTTSSGGLYYEGTAFKLTPPNPGGTEWAYTVLHTFGGFGSGQDCRVYCVPYFPTNLLLGPGGVLYGTTTYGGPFPAGGTVYQLTPPKASQADWGFTILHIFGGNDGAEPLGSLVSDANGILYGTTFGGNGVRGGDGVVFKMTPPTHGEIRWPYNVIYTFGTRRGYDGPQGRLVLGRDGALYGTTDGADSIHFCPPFGSPCGVVFKLSPPPPGVIRWPETVLHDFTGTNDDSSRPYDLTLGRDPDGTAAIFGVTLGTPGYDTAQAFEVKLAP